MEPEPLFFFPLFSVSPLPPQLSFFDVVKFLRLWYTDPKLEGHALYIKFSLTPYSPMANILLMLFYLCTLVQCVRCNLKVYLCNQFKLFSFI